MTVDMTGKEDIRNEDLSKVLVWMTGPKIGGAVLPTNKANIIIIKGEQYRNPYCLS